jgi:hypothetical protein
LHYTPKPKPPQAFFAPGWHVSMLPRTPEPVSEPLAPPDRQGGFPNPVETQGKRGRSGKKHFLDADGALQPGRWVGQPTL